LCSWCGHKDLSVTDPGLGTAGLVAFATKNRTSDFRLERNAVVLAAVIANDLEFLLSVAALGGFLCAALLATLRRSHVPLIKRLLLFLSE
jgi:hypothetical protein